MSILPHAGRTSHPIPLRTAKQQVIEENKPHNQQKKKKDAYRKMLCNTLSSFSANGSSTLLRPKSSNLAGKSIVWSDASDAGL